MERHRSRSTDFPHGSDELWSARNKDERRGSPSVDVRPIAARIPRPSPRPEGGVKTSARNSVEQRFFLPSESLRDQLQAIRRRLWILNATLESLHAKIELACRMRSEVASGDGSDHPRKIPDASGGEPLTLKAHGAIGGWWARWKLARLRSRADRAERRAVVAIHDASASFSAALDAVLHAAIVRAKADEIVLDPSCVGASRRAAENGSVSLQ
jgi:hypothetical protein